MTAMPVAQGTMEAYVDGLNLLTVNRANESFGAYLQEQRFITAADLRQLGYAPVAEVRQVVIELVQSESLHFTELRTAMQTLFDNHAIYRRSLTHVLQLLPQRSWRANPG